MDWDRDGGLDCRTDGQSNPVWPVWDGQPQSPCSILNAPAPLRHKAVGDVLHQLARRWFRQASSSTKKQRAVHSLRRQQRLQLCQTISPKRLEHLDRSLTTCVRVVICKIDKFKVFRAAHSPLVASTVAELRKRD